jgi:hypothetical protein
VSSCYHDSVSLVRIATAARRAASGPLAGEVVQTARDGNALYALVAPKPQADSHPRCNVPAAPCVLQRVPDPALAPAPFKPHSPIFS